MKDHHISRLGKSAVVLLVFIAIVSAIINITRGYVGHPAAFSIIIAGFLLFAVSKFSVIRKKWISFGPGFMTENMANVYRLGYWLMLSVSF